MASNPVKKAGFKAFGRMFLAIVIAGVVLYVAYTLSASIRAKLEAKVGR